MTCKTYQPHYQFHAQRATEALKNHGPLASNRESIALPTNRQAKFAKTRRLPINRGTTTCQ